MFHYIRNYFLELSSLLAESEIIRIEQETSGDLGQLSSNSIPSNKKSTEKETYLTFLFGSWDSNDFANLLDEFKWSRNPWKLIIFASIISLFHAWCSIIKGFIAGKVTDALATVFTSSQSTIKNDTFRETNSMDAVYHSLFLLTLISLIEWALLTSKNVIFDIAYCERALLSRTRYFTSMIKQDARFHSTHRSAELNQRLWVDANEIDEIVVFTLERFLIGITSLITIAGMMRADSGLTTLCIALRIPFALQMIERSVQLGASFARILTVSLEKAKSRSAELLSNVKVIQSSAAEIKEVEGFAALVLKHLRIVRGSSFARNALIRAEGIVTILINLILLAYGAYRIKNGDLTLGQFQALRGTADGFTVSFSYSATVPYAVYYKLDI
jgi:ATP-binding cassette, subfamily B, bacterial AbcA/BmrA